MRPKLNQYNMFHNKQRLPAPRRQAVAPCGSSATAAAVAVRVCVARLPRHGSVEDTQRGGLDACAAEVRLPPPCAPSIERSSCAPAVRQPETASADRTRKYAALMRLTLTPLRQLGGSSRDARGVRPAGMRAGVRGHRCGPTQTPARIARQLRVHMRPPQLKGACAARQWRGFAVV
jgi:hypothetical protein